MRTGLLRFQVWFNFLLKFCRHHVSAVKVIKAKSSQNIGYNNLCRVLPFCKVINKLTFQSREYQYINDNLYLKVCSKCNHAINNLKQSACHFQINVYRN